MIGVHYGIGYTGIDISIYLDCLQPILSIAFCLEVTLSTRDSQLYPLTSLCFHLILFNIPLPSQYVSYQSHLCWIFLSIYSIFILPITITIAFSACSVVQETGIRLVATVLWPARTCEITSGLVVCVWCVCVISRGNLQIVIRGNYLVSRLYCVKTIIYIILYFYYLLCREEFVQLAKSLTANIHLTVELKWTRQKDGYIARQSIEVRAAAATAVSKWVRGYDSIRFDYQ